MERLMKGVAVTAPGQAVIVRDIPVPEPGEYGALVRIRCCAYTGITDAGIGAERSEKDYPFIPGTGGVGAVTAVGRKVRYITKGDRFLSPLVPPSEKYGSDRGNFAAYGIVYDVKAMLEDGADIPVIPDGSCIPVHLPVSDSDAAMLPVIAAAISAARASEPGRNGKTAVAGSSVEAVIAKEFLSLLGEDAILVDDRLKRALRAGTGRSEISDGGESERLSEALRGSCDAVVDFSGKELSKSDVSFLLRDGGVIVPASGKKDYPGSFGAVPFTSEGPDGDSYRLAMTLVGEGFIVPSSYYSDIMPVEFIGECIRLGREGLISAAVLSI
ncbi:MAG: hypothetical protein MJ137_01135 [Clostridia bacterium]|nr:hypothetical protein [Clostridia bacterium]